VFAAVSEDGFSLDYASNYLRKNYDIVLAAISNEGTALYYAAKHLRSNFQIVLAAVSRNGLALQFAVDFVRANFQIVLAAVSNDGLALEYADKALQANYEIANNEYALEFAAEVIKDDEKVIAEFIYGTQEQQHIILRFASQRIRSHPEILESQRGNKIKGSVVE